MTLLKLNLTTFGVKVSQPLILKRKYLILAFGFRDWEGENSLSSSKRYPRVVCKTSWRKAFPRVRIWLSYLHRERELQFFSSGHESQGEKKFSRGHKSQGVGQFSRHLVSVELYCSVQSIRYSKGTFFEEKFLGTIFEEKWKN